MARLVAAALLGIGIESFLGRNAGLEAYAGMLNLKIIWSFVAVVGLVISLIQEEHGGPPAGWMIVLIFLGFNVLWIYWRRKLSKIFS